MKGGEQVVYLLQTLNLRSWFFGVSFVRGVVGVIWGGTLQVVGALKVRLSVPMASRSHVVKEMETAVRSNGLITEYPQGKFLVSCFQHCFVGLQGDESRQGLGVPTHSPVKTDQVEKSSGLASQSRGAH